MRGRREGIEEEAAAETEEEEEGGGISLGLLNLNIETADTEDDAEEGLAEALGMEVEEEEGSKGEEGGGWTLMVLGALKFLTQ